MFINHNGPFFSTMTFKIKCGFLKINNCGFETRLLRDHRKGLFVLARTDGPLSCKSICCC